MSNIVREYKDLDFNFTRLSNGDVNTVKGENAIKQAMRNLILTNHHERPFNPNFGCDITKNLFENNNPALAIEMQSSVNESVQNDEHRVSLVKSSVKTHDEKVEIDITVKSKNIPKDISVNIDLERLR